MVLIFIYKEKSENLNYIRIFCYAVDVINACIYNITEYLFF